jgi:ribokinase
MAGTNPQVVVIGGSYMDMAIKCDQIPTVGQNIGGTALSYTATGPGPNQAAAAALCGCEVRLVSQIGGGPFGKMILDSLVEFGVNTEFVQVAEAKYTGTIVTVVSSNGENTSITYIGANNALLEQHIDKAENAISEADVCLIHGGLPKEAIVRAINSAKLHGTKIILNPARPIEQNGIEIGVLPMEYFTADILIPNLYEAADITEHCGANIHSAKLIGSDLVARGVGTAVITMGKRGCMVVDRSSAYHVAAFEIELVDQTCTGDAFAGALAACVAVKDNMRDAVKFANAAGALACTKFGSVESLPTQADIIELLQKEDVG